MFSEDGMFCMLCVFQTECSVLSKTLQTFSLPQLLEATVWIFWCVSDTFFTYI